MARAARAQQLLALVVVALGACGKSSDPPPAPVPIATPDAAPPATDWLACESALRAAPKLPATRRVQAILEGCKPCGDWKPLLDWQREHSAGGPTRPEIEQAMLACNAYCDAGAKQRFLGTLDAARGKQNTRGPWRHLGELCKGAVSAVPDARYASPPHFALDRIARAAAARPELAALLDAIELPMPAFTSGGTGFELAKSPVTAPDVGAIALTATATELRVAATPRAKLGKGGVTLLGKGEPYPGPIVKTQPELEAALATLGDGDIAIFAPYGMPASHVVAPLAMTKRTIRLAVMAKSAIASWPNTGTIPVALKDRAPVTAIKVKLDADADAAGKQVVDMKDTIVAANASAAGNPPVVIEVMPKATVEGLAKLLGALAYFDVAQVALVRAK